MTFAKIVGVVFWVVVMVRIVLWVYVYVTGVQDEAEYYRRKAREAAERER